MALLDARVKQIYQIKSNEIITSISHAKYKLGNYM